MSEKNKPMSEVDKITFNWERVKNKAASKREELVANAPKVVKRSVNTVAIQEKAPSYETTSTTDAITDPYHNIEMQANNLSTPSHDTPSHDTPSRRDQYKIPNNNIDIDIDRYNNNNPNTTNPLNTTSPQLLPAAPPQGSMTSCDELLGPKRNAVELLQAIKESSISGSDLTVDERRLVVRSMRELGQTQDAIASILKVSRRTIVSDYKVIRHEQALAIQRTDTTDIAGEVYSTAKICIRRALQAGHFKTVSVVMRDMVEVLQSLGVVYRAPKTSMAATMHGSIGSNNGFQKYMDGIGNDKNKVIDVLDCMFNAIDKDSLN